MVSIRKDQEKRKGRAFAQYPENREEGKAADVHSGRLYARERGR